MSLHTHSAQASTDVLKAMFDSVDAILAYVDHDLRYRHINRVYEAWFGQSADHIVGKTMSEVLGEEAAAAVLPYARQALSGQTVRFETVVPLPLLGPRRVRASYFPDLRNGEVHGFTAMVNDVTEHWERERSEAAAKESEERFRHLADHAPVLIWMANTDNSGVWFNKPWLDFVGRTMQQELGFGWAESVHPDDAERCVATCSQAIREERAFTMEFRMRRADGAYRWMLDNGVPFYDRDGVLAGYLGTCIDISQKHDVEDQLMRLNELLEERVQLRTAELEHLNKELQSFSYSVSHDLRAPLRSINAYSRIVARDYKDNIDDEGQRLLNRIAESAKNMADLIDGLLSHARLGRTELKRSRINLSGMAEELVQELLADGSRKAEVTIQPALFAHVDGELMRLVLENLISNAWKFTASRERAKVEFGGSLDSIGQVFYVRDNGVGFDPAYTSKLFQPFERLHTDVAGTGIGLANVRQIIERHGGRVWAESQPGEGATFYFTIPQNL